jgi:hypothetical protein
VYARSTTVRGDAEAVHDAIAMVRDAVMHALQEMDGWVGLSMLVDRAYGTSIVTSAWDSERALIRSRDQVTDLRDRAAEQLGGAAEVEEWEIALLHRESIAGAGACSRVTWLKVHRHEIDHQVDVFRSTLFPQLEMIPGFCSASLLVNRETGRATPAVTYESREAMEDSRTEARRLREEATRRIAAEIHDVAEMELALAHLRVPERI